MLGFQFFADFGCDDNEANAWNQDKSMRLSKRRANRKGLNDLASDGWQMNCFAIYVPDNPRDENIYRYSNNGEVFQSAVTAVFGHMNSEVATSSVSWSYMRTKAKRINERLARKLHPRLFAYLDSN